VVDNVRYGGLSSRTESAGIKTSRRGRRGEFFEIHSIWGRKLRNKTEKVPILGTIADEELLPSYDDKGREEIYVSNRVNKWKNGV